LTFVKRRLKLQPDICASMICLHASAVCGRVVQLLDKSPQKRLHSVESLRRLPYFRDVNFDGLYHQQVSFLMLPSSFTDVECL